MGTEPGRIVVAGDWHGNARWATSVIREAAVLLADEPRKLILQLGDYGIWPGLEGTFFQNAVIGTCLEQDVQVWFIDGNHEDFTQIEQFRIPAGDGYLMAWLPRGHRWTWHGRTWLACGGGVSLDRAIRTEGRDWWPEEEITDEQEAVAVAGGHADVLISHDCPSGVAHTFPERPSWWDQRDIDRSQHHEERLQRIVDAVQPSDILHGHLHRKYGRMCDFGYGPVRVTGLDADGRSGNFALLNVKAMEWIQ
jgi:hypothetical protein